MGRTKILNKDQEQNVRNHSTGIQAKRDVNIIKIGLTIDEVRAVALDVFRANFYELQGEAKAIAKARAEEITEEFISKLMNENPSGLEKSYDPDFQYALFTVQKEYAKCGDKDLGDLLVDLLVDRSKQKQRDILQIVLNESLKTAPKLTENQLAALAIIFLFRYTQNHMVRNHQTLGEYFDKYVSPFASNVVKNMACYQHLEYTGCGTIDLTQRSLESILGNTYQGLFMKGFDEIGVLNKDITIGLDDKFFIPCINDPSKIQVRYNNKGILERSFEEYKIIPEDRKKSLSYLM